MKNEKPLKDRVIVALPKPEEEKTASGLILPAKDVEDFIFGTIVEMGDTAFARRLESGAWERYPWAPKVGDKVRLHKYGGINDLRDKERPMRMVNADDILSVIKE